MGNSSNNSSDSDRKIKSDRGGSIGRPLGDAAIGQRPAPPTSALPPLKKPKK
ncbi:MULTISPECIES: hypothetical protein [unclassified Psychrobacter]|uniref:hypothetical protein n=1 Tax=unclassified Psychrobacter TaxID=196806 RepID=UPI0012E9F6CA|nr:MULTISPECIES: hypothetical protein [unclassified Psychrobacter]